MIERAFPNIISSNVAATKAWFCDLLDLATEFDSDWFVHLRASEAAGVELGIISATHDIVAGLGTAGSAGVMLTFVVPNVDATHERARELGYDVVEAPRDLFYGQRRMVLREPNGTLVDVSSECEPSQEFLDSLAHRSVH